MALVAGVAALTGLPQIAVAQHLAQAGDEAARQAAADATTLAQTLRAGTANGLGYRMMATGAGEPHILREDLVSAQDGRTGRRRSLLSFLHLTDQHLIDGQSPARVEFTDRFVEGSCPPPFESAWRAHEAASVRIAAAMLAKVRGIGISPVTGVPIAAAICTGDNTDNQQANEVEWFLGVMDGGVVTPNSGDPTMYEGSQTSGDLAYWHPAPAIQDRYKTTFGFPDAPDFLERALAPFTAPGIGLPWYVCYGNHDGLAQGNAPTDPVIEGIATGPVKVLSPPPANPCVLEAGELPIGGVPTAPATSVTADPDRRMLTRAQYAQAHLDAPGLPSGHGLTTDNVTQGRMFYAADVGALRWIVLDTVNPGGFSEGSIGDAQLAFLEAELAAADQAGKLAVLFSHHGLRSLDNPVITPDPLDPAGGDLPRHMSEEVRALCNAHPSLILWVNGHTHRNTIGAQGTFWDVGTAAHIDWPPQSRLIEVVDNADGTLSIFTTMVDLAVEDPVVALAQELMANDPQAGFDGTGPGEADDRNTELIIANPFAQAGPVPSATPTATPLPTMPPSSGTTTSSQTALPRTGGGGTTLTVGGALLVAGMAGIRTLRRPRR
ncbi:MAG: TIGR03767 family metallophosphoesterase [Euzebya sp.]